MWVIITRDQCNFCDSAKALLKGSGFQYVEYNVESGSSRWIAHLMKKAGLTTVPQVFYPDGVHLGGYVDLKDHITKGW